MENEVHLHNEHPVRRHQRRFLMTVKVKERADQLAEELKEKVKLEEEKVKWVDRLHERQVQVLHHLNFHNNQQDGLDF
jgi:hypothetical protein